MSDAPDERWVPLGLIGRPVGLAGEVWFRGFSERAESVVQGARVRLTLDGAAREFVVAGRRESAKGVALRLRGLATRDEVAPWVRATLELRRRDFAPLPAGEWYQIDLVGVVARDPEGREIGPVVRVESYPSIDAVVLSTAEGEREYPLSDAVLRELDVPAGVLVIDPTALDDAG